MDPLTQAPSVQANPLAQQFPALAPQNGQVGTVDQAQLLAQIQALMGNNNLQGQQGQGLGQITAINPAAIQNAGPATGGNLSGFPTLRQLQGFGGAPQGLPQGLPQAAAAPANNGDSTNGIISWNNPNQNSDRLVMLAYFTGLTVATHTFDLYWKVSAGTGSIFTSVAKMQMLGMEV